MPNQPADIDQAKEAVVAAALRWRYADRGDGWSARSLLMTVNRLASAVDRYEQVQKQTAEIEATE